MQDNTEYSHSILIADSGSSKCDWVLLGPQGKIVLKTRTKGLNPAVFAPETLWERLENNADLLQVKDHVAKLHFYGAGCGTETPRNQLRQLLKNFFPNTKEVQVFEDMAAAVFAVTNEPGLVCILGTGSNSCYFDGKNIHTNIASLGYLVMDEASGNYFGKQLLRDYFYGKMPPEVARLFETRFDLSPDFIKINLYKRENPNAYLAAFSEFIFTQKQHDYFHKLLSGGIENFLENHVLAYPEARELPVHFVGSVAYLARDIVREVALRYQLQVGNFVEKPIDGLCAHYKNQLTSR